MKLYGHKVGSLETVAILSEWSVVEIMNDKGEVLRITDGKFSQHGEGGFNVHSGEGVLLINPQASNAVVLKPEHPGGVYLGVKV